MVNKNNYDGLKSKIDEKEKELIEKISERVAGEIGDSLSDSVDSITDTLSNADTTAQGINESLEKLSENVQVLKEYDFSDQFLKLKNSQEALDKSTDNAKKTMDQSQKANEQLINDISTALNTWQELVKELADVSKSTSSENRKIKKTLSELNECMSTLSEIDGKLIDTVKAVEEKEATIVEQISEQASTSVSGVVEKKIDTYSEKISEALDSGAEKIEGVIERSTTAANMIERSVEKIISKTQEYEESDLKSEITRLSENDQKILNEIESVKNKKISPVTIATAAMSGILIILNIILLFIK